MAWKCAECKAAFPPMELPSGELDPQRVPNGLVLVRLVCDGMGYPQDWGTYHQTKAPCAPVCETCLTRISLRHIVFNLREIPETAEKRVFGWYHYADPRYRVAGHIFKERLPSTYEIIRGLEIQGTVPTQHASAGFGDWLVTLWRKMIVGKRA